MAYSDFLPLRETYWSIFPKLKTVQDTLFAELGFESEAFHFAQKSY